jgi:trigger factor
MNIEKFSTDEQTAEISIIIAPEDYQNKLTKGLKDYAQKARIPGFRPGKVPVGMVKKMVGKSLLADELNNITSDAIFNYIKENNLDIIGNPLPKESPNTELELDELKSYTFKFEIAYAPTFDLEVSKNKSYDFHRFEPEAKFIDEQVATYQKRVGEVVEYEVSELNDDITGTLTELDENGEAKENGIVAVGAKITFDDIKNENHQQALIGLNMGDTITLNLKEVIENEVVIASLLKIDSSLVEALNPNFSFKVEKIERVKPAEINQEFFDKLFGPGIINSEEELRERIKNDAIAHYEKDAENRFFNEVVEDLVNNTNFTLPEDFLKRWLVSVNRENVSTEDILQNFSKYEKGIRWQLIEAKLVKDNNITVSEDDVVDFFQNEYMSYFGMGLDNEEMLGRIRDLAKGMLKNEKEVNRAYDKIYIDRLTQLFKNGFKLNVIASDFDTWLNYMKQPLSSAQ